MPTTGHSCDGKPCKIVTNAAPTVFQKVQNSIRNLFRNTSFEVHQETRRREEALTERVKLFEAGKALRVSRECIDDVNDTVLEENPSAHAA